MPALAAAVAAFGASRLLVGSDYPFLSSHEPYARTVGFLGEAGLGAQDGARTLTENAREMLPPR
jgi:predicted TIM-barrel fold metal-dependent hydrolase